LLLDSQTGFISRAVSRKALLFHKRLSSKLKQKNPNKIQKAKGKRPEDIN